MKSVRFAILLAAVIVVQIGFLAALRPFGVVPNLILILVVLVGLAGTASRALTAALIGGLLLDLTSGADFGLRLGLLVLLALATGLVHRAGLDLTGPAVALVLVALATVVSDVVVLVGLAGDTTHWPVGLVVGQVVIEIMVNLGLTLAVRPLAHWAVAESGPAIG